MYDSYDDDKEHNAIISKRSYNQHSNNNIL